MNVKITCRKAPMIRIGMPWIIDAATKIGRLSGIEENIEKFSLFLAVRGGKDTLDQLFVSSIYRPYLRVSLQQGADLSSRLQSVIDRLNEDWDKAVIPSWEIAAIRSEASAFLTIFMSELGTVPSYLVQPKGSHDVEILTQEGQALFPEDILAKVPETLSDMRDAAKALAYELPTSCGFHAFRVLEAVLRRYWDHVSNGAKRPDVQTIGVFAEALKRDQYGEQKVWETLKQIKTLHRNPLAHPEVILTVEEAIGILGIARSAVGAMLHTMPDVAPTTTNPSPSG